MFTHRRDLVGDVEPELNTNTSVALYINKYGQVVARSNATWVAFATPVIPSNQWSRFSLNLDYSNKLWAIYLAGPVSNALAAKVASGLAFANTNFASMQSWQVTCGTNTMMYFDNLTMATTNSAPPLSIDSDGDGLPDWWEAYYFGGPTNGVPDANTDDTDGVPNIYEYLAGTDPTNALSYMRVSAVDISDESSSNINLAVIGGDMDPPSPYPGDRAVRFYSVLAASGNATNTKIVVAGMSNIVDNLTGTNVFTDVDAVNVYSSRWYSVMVSRGGVAYTNTEEWAMYVQSRQPNKEYLVCVPVDCSGTNVNNLNTLLGQQLGRGLYASNTNTSGDRLRYLKDDGSWAEYYLATNADNTAFWWDSVTKTAADVNVTAGMAFWLVSGENPGSFRSNAVFAGKSFTTNNVVPFTVRTNRWNMFGWPLPRPKSLVNTEATGMYTTPSNQLGFEMFANAGTTAEPTMTNSVGDQIWVWRNNTWVNWCWLVGHLGTNWDGRWWDENTSTFASFRFEPGMGYYYYHPTNQWGGTNFVWTPRY